MTAAVAPAIREPLRFIDDAAAFDPEAGGPTVWIRAGAGIEDSAGRAAAVREVIAAHLRLAPESVTVAKDVHGRPHLAVATVPLLDFSVSHVPGTLIVGVTRGPTRIGVDVEVTRGDVDPLLLARPHCTPLEFARLATLPPPARLDGFYDLWTAKEAMAKAIGHGFSFGLDAIETAPHPAPTEPEERLCIIRLGGSERFAAGWRLFHRNLAGRRIAVALG
jgi:hypothetical protein